LLCGIGCWNLFHTGCGKGSSNQNHIHRPQLKFTIQEASPPSFLGNGMWCPLR